MDYVELTQVISDRGRFGVFCDKAIQIIGLRQMVGIEEGIGTMSVDVSSVW